LDPGEQPGHRVRRVVAELRHAAVRGHAARGDLGPIDAAVTDADAIYVERLGDDDVIGAVRGDQALIAELGDAGESAALLVDRAALFDAASQRQPGAADGLDGVDRRRDPGLLVRGAASPQTPLRDRPVERRVAPGRRVAGRDHVEVAVEVERRPRALTLEPPEDVHPWGTVGDVPRADVLDGVAERAQALADESG